MTLVQLFKRKLSQNLAFCGAIPFVVSALLLLFGIQEISGLGQVGAVVKSYGLLIVSFMSGAVWGRSVSDGLGAHPWLLLNSNVIALVSWFSFLWASVTVTLWIFVVAFLGLLAIDYVELKDDSRMQEYWTTRLSVTLVVVVCLGLCAATL